MNSEEEAKPVADKKKLKQKCVVEKSFKCEKCNKCFARRNTLANHMLTHTGVKSFKCEKCNKKNSISFLMSSFSMTNGSSNSSVALSTAFSSITIRSCCATSVGSPSSGCLAQPTSLPNVLSPTK